MKGIEGSKPSNRLVPLMCSISKMAIIIQETINASNVLMCDLNATLFCGRNHALSPAGGVGGSVPQNETGRLNIKKLLSG